MIVEPIIEVLKISEAVMALEKFVESEFTTYIPAPKPVARPCP